MAGGCVREGSGGGLGEAGYLRNLLEEEADLESPWRPSVCDPHPPYDCLFEDGCVCDGHFRVC